MGACITPSVQNLAPNVFPDAIVDTEMRPAQLEHFLICVGPGLICSSFEGPLDWFVSENFEPD